MPVVLACGIETSDEQYAVVQHLAQNPVTVVGAGAGAGKTYTSVAAVLELIETGRALASQFVLITFTNQAADELRGRLHDALKRRVGEVGQARRLFWSEQRELLGAAFIGTIHGFCKQVLSLHGYALGLSREASVNFARRLRDQAAEAVAVDLVADADEPIARLVREGEWPEYEFRARLDEILQEARSRGIRTTDLLAATRAQPDDDGKPWRVRLAGLVADVERRYEEACRAEQKVDASALLADTDRLLRSNEGGWVAQKLRERFRYLFVDEFQDTSPVQESIVSALAGRLTVLVVGDRKQAIYGFAGASDTLLDRFARRHGTSSLPLRQSGRPSAHLLLAQNVLFRSMRERFPDLDEPLELTGRNATPSDRLPPIVVLTAEQDEPEAVEKGAARIGNIIGVSMDRPEGAGPGEVRAADIAVLVRTNREVELWAGALARAGVPCRSDGGTPFLHRPEIVATYRFLRLLLRYPDDVALVEALATPHFEGVDLRSREAELLAYGTQRGMPLCDAYERDYPDHLGKVLALLRASKVATVPQLLAFVERAFGLKERYRAAGDDGAAAGLDRLRDHARSLFDSDQALTLRTFLDILRREMLTSPKLDEPGGDDLGTDAVRVMTIHRSKGLEFPVVVIPGLETNRHPGRLPDFLIDPKHGLELNLEHADVTTASPAYRERCRRAQKQALSEEMRLFYVAVTRAKRMVVMLGTKPDNPPPANSYGAHSWQQEVVAAREALKATGVKFGPLA